MRAVVFKSYGPPAVLHVEEVGNVILAIGESV